MEQKEINQQFNKQYQVFRERMKKTTDHVENLVLPKEGQITESSIKDITTINDLLDILVSSLNKPPQKEGV